jgi:hypothetical protein
MKIIDVKGTKFADIGQPIDQKKMNEIYVYVGYDGEKEGIMSFSGRALVFQTKEKSYQIIEDIKEISTKTNRKIKLLKLTHREELEVIEP